METSTSTLRDDNELPANRIGSSSVTDARRPEKPVLLLDAQNSSVLDKSGGAALTPESRPNLEKEDENMLAAPMSLTTATILASDESKLAARAARIAEIKKRLQARKAADASHKNSIEGDKSNVNPVPTITIDEKIIFHPPAEVGRHEEQEDGVVKSKLALRKAAIDARNVEAAENARFEPETPPAASVHDGRVEPETPPAAAPARDDEQPSPTEVKDKSRSPRQTHSEKSKSRSLKTNEGLTRDPKQERSVPRNARRNESDGQRQSRDKSKLHVSERANSSVNRSRGESIPRKVLSADPNGSANRSRGESIPRKLLSTQTKPPSPTKSQTGTKKSKAKFKNQKDRAAASSIAEDLKRIRASVNKSRMELDKRVAAFAQSRNAGSFAEENKRTSATPDNGAMPASDEKSDKPASSSKDASGKKKEKKRRSVDRDLKKTPPASSELLAVAGKELQIPPAKKGLPPKVAERGEVQILGTAI